MELCICTHNPRPGVLSAVLGSVAAQDIAGGSFRFILIDNASTPPVSEEVLAPLRVAGIEARLLREPAPGLQRARLRAIHATTSEWILWVDDDNELSPDFIRRGFEFIAAHPEVGCFGGKLLLPSELHPAKWVAPFLPSLGIRDYGDVAIIARLRTWGPAEPAGAGAWVRRAVIDEYLRLAETSDYFFKLGRTGSSDLASCDDSCMMRCADTVGLACAYVPTLKLWHHLSPHRFRFRYLMKLMRAYGKSHVMLDMVMNIPVNPDRSHHGLGRLLKPCLRMLRTSLRQGLPFALSRVCYEYGAYKEHRRQQKRKPTQATVATTPVPATLPRPKTLPKITVVTACLNSVATIERTLKSVRDQEYPSLEYIVFDGVSTDGTLEILRRQDGLVTRLVSEKDSGVANAYNKGFTGATGDIYCWLNADDELAPGALHLAGRHFSENPGTDVFTGGCRRIYADGSVVITVPQDWYVQQLALRNGIEQPSTFWRASAHHAAGKLDESYALAFDWEWWNRLRRSGARFQSTDEVLSVYHFSDSNLTSRAGRKVVDEMYRVTREYGPRMLGIDIADVYRFIFERFDMKGDYDRPSRELPFGRRLAFRFTLVALRAAFGSSHIKAYNWNWASKQIRGVIWYK